MKTRKRRGIALGVCACLALSLAGCQPMSQNSPDILDTVAPQSEQVLPDDQPEDSASASVQPELSFTFAEFGAPVTGNGVFPLDNTSSQALLDALGLNEDTLATYETAEVPDYLLVKLTLSDGRIVGLNRIDGQVILQIENDCYDCTGKIDIDAVCDILEAAQLTAVLQSLQDITQVKLVDPGASVEETSFALTSEESGQLLELLQTNQWEIIDMYTAQDLGRDWPVWIEFYSDEVMIAWMGYGEFQGMLHTVISYRINGNEQQTANLFAPEGVYESVKSYLISK